VEELDFFCTTHTRTEGRAPVWGSEFTTEAASLQGDSSESPPCRANSIQARDFD